jgi:hypothetical protein
MKRIFIHLTVALALYLCTGQDLFAIGLGVNRTNGPESAQTLQPVYPTMLDQIMNRLKGIDIVYDTAVAKDCLFNYRLNIECYTITEKINNLYLNNTRDANHIVFSNTFGFGFVRTQFIRLWAGPQFSLAYQFVNKNNRIYDSVIYNKIGAVAGANVHATDNMTLSMEIGLRTGFGFDLTKSYANTFTSSKLEPIAALKLIFRVGDSYKSSI